MRFKNNSKMSPWLGCALVTLFWFQSASATDFQYAMDFDDANMTISSIGINPGPNAENEPHLTATPEDLVRAKVVAVINKSNIGSTAQSMRVYVNSVLTYTFPVSTGREKLEKSKSGRVYVTTTPLGYFRPYSLEKLHHSQTWDADMPDAVFFRGGIAVHATPHIPDLGKRASGGCVRLAPENAKLFFDLVAKTGTASVPTIERNGKEVLDHEKNPVKEKAYDVLIIVENTI